MIRIITLAIVTVGLVLPSVVKGQAREDADIIGTYRALMDGALLEYFIFDDDSISIAAIDEEGNVSAATSRTIIGTNTVSFNGALFSFQLEYDFLGFHEGVLAGLMFIDGEEYTASGQVFVLPLETQGFGESLVTEGSNYRNRDAIFYFETVDINSTGNETVQLRVDGSMNYVDRQEGELLRGSVQYRSDNVRFSLFFEDVNTPDTEYDIGRVEAKRVAQGGGFAGGFLTTRSYR